MKSWATAGMIVRMCAAFAVAAGILYAFPDPVVRLLAPLVVALTQWTCSYLSGLSLSLNGMILSIDGQIVLAMTLLDGSDLPPVPGTWQKHAGSTLHLLVTSMAVFAVPAMPWTRRLLLLPLALALAGMVAAFHLSVDIQETALRVVGETWLPTLPLASTEANIATFHALESHFNAVVWVKSFNDGGGSLFLAALAGLIPCARHLGPARPTRDDHA